MKVTTVADTSNMTAVGAMQYRCFSKSGECGLARNGGQIVMTADAAVVLSVQPSEEDSAVLLSHPQPVMKEQERAGFQFNIYISIHSMNFIMLMSDIVIRECSNST